MKLTKSEFLDDPRKAVSFIGMSGVGKSYLSAKLAEWGWTNYSCDHLIATKYLADKVEGGVSADNILSLSEFVGQIGDPALGGVGLEEFRHRQKMYYDAEVSVLRDLPEAMEAAQGPFVNDSAGSLCEIEDAAVLEVVGRKTLFVYLEVDQRDHPKILGRAIAYPKPLYFPPMFFNERLAEFQDEYDVAGVDDIDPAQFLSWVFPHLFTTRLPKYQRLADKYGVTIPVHALADIKSEAEFLSVIAAALDD